MFCGEKEDELCKTAAVHIINADSADEDVLDTTPVLPPVASTSSFAGFDEINLGTIEIHHSDVTTPTRSTQDASWLKAAQRPSKKRKLQTTNEDDYLERSTRALETFVARGQGSNSQVAAALKTKLDLVLSRLKDEEKIWKFYNAVEHSINEHYNTYSQ